MKFRGGPLRLADLIQDDALDALWGPPRPRCSDHNHLATAKLHAGRATGVCPHSHDPLAAIGTRLHRRGTPTRHLSRVRFPIDENSAVRMFCGGCPTGCATMGGMAQRDKRSVSFPPDLAKAIDAAAAASGTSFSAWVAETASHRLRLEAGRRGVAEWEAEYGPLSERELAEGLARARELLGRTASKRSA
jgi:hypothetical protein